MLAQRKSERERSTAIGSGRRKPQNGMCLCAIVRARVIGEKCARYECVRVCVCLSVQSACMKNTSGNTQRNTKTKRKATNELTSGYYLQSSMAAADSIDRSDFVAELFAIVTSTFVVLLPRISCQRYSGKLNCVQAFNVLISPSL